MAFYRGEEGSVKFKNAAGTVGAVASTTGWSLSLNKETLDCTAHGATFRSYVGGFIDGSGTVDLFYTGTSGDETNELITDVLTTNDAADAQFELYLSTSGSKKLTFSGIVTSAEFNTSIGEMESVSVGFQVNGTVTEAI